MSELTRRDALKLAALGGSAISIAAVAHATDDQEKPGPDSRDRQFVMGAGMTEGEAECWALAAKTAGAFFALPELHPMDKQEVTIAIHIIQNKLLSRPTYRTYLELARAVKPNQ